MNNRDRAEIIESIILSQNTICVSTGQDFKEMKIRKYLNKKSLDSLIEIENKWCNLVLSMIK